MELRPVLIGTQVVCLFVAISLILLTFMPGPHRPQDFLIVGAVGTLVSLLAIFTAYARR